MGSSFPIVGNLSVQLQIRLSMSHLKHFISRQSLSPSQSRAISRRIYQTAVACRPGWRSGNFQHLDNRDLQFVFNATDDLFFNGMVRQLAERKGFPLQFRVSQRMTRSGGITKMTSLPGIRRKREFEIAVSAPLLFHSFQEDAGTATLVTGIPCLNRLEALQKIVEHEMLHLIELMVWDDSNCAAHRFRSIAARIFGHSQSNHQLLTPRDIARRDHNISPGDWVHFLHRGCQLKGRVNRITKRATVLVPCRDGTRYSDGQRYAKFYVPFKDLRKSA